jgi:hypothetical protein
MTPAIRKNFALALLVLAGMGCATLLPAAEAAAPVAIEELEELEEVIVHGTRLNDRIVKAEDKFFRLYNQINKNDDYDVHCAYLELDAGSRIQDRICTPGFFADAIVEQMVWAERCRGSQDSEGNYVSAPACYTPPPPDAVLFHRADDYAANVMKVIKTDPRLGDMAGELDQLHMERRRLQRRYLEIKEREGEERAKEPRYRPVIR